MPRTITGEHKQVVSVRFTERMIERIRAVLDGEQFGEFVRIAVLRKVEQREMRKR
jgi:hypothetical protein